MAEAKGFRELKVWQRGKALAVKVYEISGKGRFNSDYGLREQVRRASVSIPSNIAEGDTLGTNKQSIRHFHIAKGSCAELMTQFEIASEIGYIPHEIFAEVQEECLNLSGMLERLIRARSKVH
ncbi:MAG: four helix bundle protein [Candidatus Aminicenantes bacterium]|nr:four helix bundle protein [Candidatus Aminicenantes bacterium]